MLQLSPWLSLLSVLVAMLLARRLAAGGEAQSSAVLVPALERVTAWMNARWAPALAGVLTAAATWYVWGGLTRTAVVHDESAYLLQAQLFARMQWTASSPPLPQFFQQLYVNLLPAVASKYPPGTSLLLAPGALLGVPGLPVVLMNAFTGVLVFSLARRIGGGATATIAWLLWVTSFPVLYFHAMYLSEVPSSLAWLVAWWGVMRWRDSDRPHDLAITAAAVGVCWITRPLTALALSVVVVAVVAARIVRRRDDSARSVARVAAPFAAAVLIVIAFAALWSWRSTGDPRETPLTLYTRSFVPFDRLGFGARREDAPSAQLPWDQRLTSLSFYEEHRRHTVQGLPLVLAARARMITHDMWYDWRGGLALVAIAGFFGAPLALWIGLAALLVQLLFYLLYAHPWTWSLYYTETLPVLALLTALGVARVCASTASGTRRDHQLAIAAVVLIVATSYPALLTLRAVRTQIAADHQYYDAFTRLLPRTSSPLLVFVRYAPAHNDGLALVRNVPDFDGAPVLTAYDRGAENARLLAVMPQRVPYLFDEATWTLRPLVP